MFITIRMCVFHLLDFPECVVYARMRENPSTLIDEIAIEICKSGFLKFSIISKNILREAGDLQYHRLK